MRPPPSPLVDSPDQGLAGAGAFLLQMLMSFAGPGDFAAAGGVEIIWGVLKIGWFITTFFSYGMIRGYPYMENHHIDTIIEVEYSIKANQNPTAKTPRELNH